MDIKKLRTQKAKGIYKSYTKPPDRAGLAHGDHSVMILPHYPYPIDEDKFPLFARPCPTRPRHGFVESRPVTDHEGVLTALTDTLRKDPLGELVLAKPLSGKWSGVATNAGVTWGMGNDGATGYGKTMTIPAPGQVRHWNKFMLQDIFPATLHDYGITDTVYAELVEDNGLSRLVQLRDGPKQSAEVNFIPERMKVSAVFRPYGAENDLLRWEKAINTAMPGTVVELFGSSLSSHFAVHAVQKGIPVVTDRRVAFGDVLEPTKTKRPKLKADDYRDISRRMTPWIADRDYIIPGDLKYPTVSRTEQRKWLPHVQGAIATAVATVQTQHLWDNAEHLMRLRAIAVPTLIRFLVSAVNGELRHYNYGDGGFEFPAGFEPESYSKLRNNYYLPVLQGRVSLDDMRKFLPTAAETFRDYDVWEDGYGSDGWADIAEATETLIADLEAFRKSPTKLRWENLIENANNAVNTMHNNGRAAEKWISEDLLAAVNLAPVVGFINDFAARVALNLPIALDRKVFD